VGRTRAAARFGLTTQIHETRIPYGDIKSQQPFSKIVSMITPPALIGFGANPFSGSEGGTDSPRIVNSSVDTNQI
jgi:hypothetical protein